MKFLVVGCGSIGKRHLHNLKSLSAGELIAFDIDAERCKAVNEEYDVKVPSDFEDAMKQKPDVVLVCTPTSLHIPYALAAAREGCHLFIEKPVSHTMDGVDELIETVKSKNLVTLVGCNFRFHWGTMLVKKIMDEGKLGKVVSAQAHFGQYLPDWHPWEDYRRGYSAQKELGGGIILDSVHELDYLYWLLGTVKEVYCVADRLGSLDIDVEDTAEMILRFADRSIAEVHLDYLQRSYDRSLKVVGEEGVVIWNFQDNCVKFYRAEDKKWQIFQKSLPQDVNEMYIEEMEHFLRCLNGDEKPMVNVEVGKYVLSIALAAKKSAETKLPVAL